jgi:ADP-ribose pyrophosphatase YjhB (NUDIX family)
VSDQLDTKTGWLDNQLLDNIRANVPLVYVDAVPVRVNEVGRVTDIGLLLRQAADGSISRMVVSGRVLYGERVRDALLRHLEKDLGPVALPRIPPEVAPFTVVEYFPDPDISGFHDPRHHAVSLAFVVPVSGDCQPTQEALDLGWYSPEEVMGEQVRRDMTGGHDRLIRLALAHVGLLP